MSTCIRILGKQDNNNERFKGYKYSFSKKGALEYLVFHKKEKTPSPNTQDENKKLFNLLREIRSAGTTPIRNTRNASNTGNRHLYEEQGRVFQSNPYSFTRKNSLYIVGLNPNLYAYANARSSPNTIHQQTARKANYRYEGMMNTIGEHTIRLIKNNSYKTWSAYTDERMGPAETKLQKSFIQFFKDIGVPSYSVPATNIIFVRTSSQINLENQYNKQKIDTLIDMCWKFHKKALSYVKPKVILSFSSMATDALMDKMGGKKNWTKSFSCRQPTDEGYFIYRVFTRTGVSAPHMGSCNIIMQVTHPARVNWNKAKLSPACVYKKVISGSLFTNNKTQICPRTPTKKNIGTVKKMNVNKSRGTKRPQSGEQWVRKAGRLERKK